MAFPGMPDLDGIMKDAKAAREGLEKNHKESVALLTEIRELLKEISKALKGE
jgi:hypothetical protein